MPIDILMPALSPTMTEGKLAKWHVAVGDAVKSGMVVAEIETDKATMEVEAIDEGTVGAILVAEGTEGVAVNSIIAQLLEAGEGKDALGAALKPTTALAVNSAPVETKTPIATAPVATNIIAPATNSKGRVFASPLAKRIAKQKGVDLAQIKGTGPHGRIVRKDVENAPVGGKAMVSAALPTSSINARALADAYKMPYTAEANSPIRKVIAKRLTESKQTIPHFYLTVDCQIDALLALRAQFNEAQPVKVSVNDLVIKACALALQQIPAANAAWTDEAILKFKHSDISVAVATPNGLITPIIKQAESKNLAAISTEMKDLAARARDNKLKPEEFTGGTFTISNLGMFGIKDFGAIINPPQACILAVGAGEKRPVVIDDQIKIATVMSCTLSVDHRVVDGAVGAEFISAFKALIEKPLKLILS